MDDFSTTGRAHLQQVVDDAVRTGDVPGVVAAVAAGSTVHVVVAGEATVAGAPMRPDTLFRIASLTKPMTAVLILTLIEDGAFRFDDPVEQHLPELADRRVLRRPTGPLEDTVPATRPPTVRDLLTFTWGLGMQGAMFTSAEPWPIVAAASAIGAFGPPHPAQLPDPDTGIGQLGALPLITEPGQTWLYSTGSQVLGVLAARATGTPFEVLLTDRVLTPLAMTDTAFWTADTHRLATAYRRSGDGVEVVDPPDGQWARPPLFCDGAAGLVSSAADVVAFGRMLLRGGAGVLRPELVGELLQDRMRTDQRVDWPGPDLLAGRGWGYGLALVPAADGRPARYGWDGGSGTSWTNVPERDLTVVVLTQREFDEHGAPRVCDLVLDAALDALAG